MTAIKTNKIKKALKKKGFQEHVGDHWRYVYCVDGKKTRIRTMLSHGKDEYGNHLLAAVARQMHLSNVQLADFIKCPLTEDAYRELLVQAGEISVGYQGGTSLGS